MLPEEIRSPEEIPCWRYLAKEYLAKEYLAKEYPAKEYPAIGVTHHWVPNLCLLTLVIYHSILFLFNIDVQLLCSIIGVCLEDY